MTDLDLLPAKFSERHESLGGDEGLLGKLVEGPGASSDGGGAWAHYERGSLFRNPHDGGLYAVHGPVRDRWSALGWEGSFLGYPTGDVEVGPDDRLVGRFEAGEIEWQPGAEPTVSPARSAFEEYGGLYEARITGQWQLELSASGEFTLAGKLYRRDGSGLQISSLLACVVTLPTGVAFGVARTGTVEKAPPETFGPDDTIAVTGHHDRLREIWLAGDARYADRLYARDEQGAGVDIPEPAAALDTVAREACGERGVAFTELVVLQPAQPS